MLNRVSIETVTISYGGCDYEISYLIRRASNETVGYLHGLGSSKYDFFGACRHNELTNFTLFAFDFPGCGNSSYFDQALEIDDLVEITNTIVSTLRLDKLSLVGHSMGGLTALLFSTRYSDKVSRFINVEGNITSEDCHVFSRRIARLSWQQFVTRDPITSLCADFASLPYVGAQIFADTLGKAVQPKAFYDYCRSIVRYSDSDTLMQVFKELSIPRLFMYGSGNRHLSYLPELERNGVVVVEVPNSHHWPHHDNPDFYFNAIREFIAAN